MAADEVETAECPFCKEEIRANALLCKHCGSRLGARPLKHEGVCPYCKEEIHPEATRCKHCRSNLEVDEPGGCGCAPSAMRRFAERSPRTMRRFAEPSALAMREAGYPDPECFHECFWRCVDTTGDAQWCWIACAYACPEVVVAR
jgi:uncharacterized CHY-type Zn-finger protein